MDNNALIIKSNAKLIMCVVRFYLLCTCDCASMLGESFTDKCD